MSGAISFFRTLFPLTSTRSEIGKERKKEKKKTQKECLVA
jgi:hypothetical protein